MPDTSIGVQTFEGISPADAARVPTDIQYLADKVKSELTKDVLFTYYPDKPDEIYPDLWKLADNILRRTSGMSVGNIKQINNFDDYCAKLAYDSRNAAAAAGTPQGYAMMFSKRYGYPYSVNDNSSMITYISSLNEKKDRHWVRQIMNGIGGNGKYDTAAKKYNNTINELSTVNSMSTATDDVPKLDNGLRVRAQFFNNVLPRNDMNCPDNNVDRALTQALNTMGTKLKPGSPYYNTFMIMTVPEGGSESGAKYAMLYNWMSDTNNGGVSSTILNACKSAAMQSNSVTEQSTGISKQNIDPYGGFSQDQVWTSQ